MTTKVHASIAILELCACQLQHAYINDKLLPPKAHQHKTEINVHIHYKNGIL